MKHCIEFYAAKDYLGIHFFDDCPDLVKYNDYTVPEWTGYPFNFGSFTKLKTYIMNSDEIKRMDELDNPVKISVNNKSVKIELV